MNYYVVSFPRRAPGCDRPDWRRGRILSGHTERAVAERMAEGMRAGNLFDRLYLVFTPDELRGRSLSKPG
jgi:hypothetical protein